MVTHLPLMPHICVGELGQHWLAPNRSQAITWTNADLLSIGPLKTIFSEIRIEKQNFSFLKMHLKMSKWWPFCPGRDELMTKDEKRRQYDETLSATGGCTTANDVVILQTVPVPKVTLLWRHDTTRQNTAVGSRRPSAPWWQKTMDQIPGVTV